jgi:putative ABC transport system substrate-binding protein
MRRRDFVNLIGGAAVACPLGARAQQPAKLPTIGFLGTTTAASWNSWTAKFVERLRQLGWIDSQTVAIEYRWGEGHNERYAEIAAEFVRLKVDVIVTAGLGTFAAKQATSTIPVVFAVLGDPVGTGLVKSLARPGGNVTGLSVQATDLAGKRLGLLREVVPTLRHLAIMANVGFPPAVLETQELETTASKLGLDVVALEIRAAGDIAPAFVTLNGRADAMYVAPDPLLNADRIRISALALTARLPTMYGIRENVDAGGLISYGPDYGDQFRRAAEYVDKILRGAKPGDLPIEQPTKFELVVNLRTAKALGISIPSTLLSLADEVIE